MRCRLLPRPLLGLLAGAWLATGCSGIGTQLGEGQRCVRSTQCAAGLVCNMGVCTSDLGSFGMGMVPMRDAGPVDAAEVDGGDASAELDAGRIEIDSGTGETDAGPTEIDSGRREADSGPGEVDSGPGEIDGGPIDIDAAAPEADAGP